jgi:hypothetical protein
MTQMNPKEVTLPPALDNAVHGELDGGELSLSDRARPI